MVNMCAILCEKEENVKTPNYQIRLDFSALRDKLKLSLTFHFNKTEYINSALTKTQLLSVDTTHR